MSMSPKRKGRMGKNPSDLFVNLLHQHVEIRSLNSWEKSLENGRNRVYVTQMSQFCDRKVTVLEVTCNIVAVSCRGEHRLFTNSEGEYMRICKAIWGILLCLGFVLVGRGEAADTKLKGVMFADYYIVNGTGKEENGFRFRRIYLTHDLKWNDAFSGRVRLEAKDAGFSSDKKMEPFVKHAYLRYKKNGHMVYMGLSSTLTWNVSESVWGYRSVEKTIMDRRKIASSADIGIAYYMRLDEDGKVNARVMLANGSGQSSETDKYKKIYGLLHFEPGSLNLTAYVDWEKRAGNQDRTTFAAFIGIKKKNFHGGLEGFAQRRNHAADNTQVRGLSLFGTGQIGEKIKVFARSDFFDPDDGSGDDGEYWFLGGLDIEPVKDIHIMPNVMSTSFQAPESDMEVIPRLTLYVKF